MRRIEEASIYLTEHLFRPYSQSNMELSDIFNSLVASSSPKVTYCKSIGCTISLMKEASFHEMGIFFCNHARVPLHDY
jgi:hypothetical protein